MADEMRKHRDYLLWLLAQRDYSRATLERKLKDRGLTLEAARGLIDALTNDGIYDERRFARNRARSLIRRGWGAGGVKAKLRAERVTVTEGELSAAYDELRSSPAEELDQALEKVLRRYSRRTTTLEPRELRDKVVRSLVARGHRVGDVLAAYQRVLESMRALEARTP